MSPTAGERLESEPSPVSVALAAEIKRRKTHANSEAMLRGFGLGPEGRTCGECYYFGTSVATGRHACFAFPKPQGRWQKRWPACGRWRE